MSDGPLGPLERDDVALLLYDYFKHLTGLALLTLGGVLTISQGEGGVAREDMVPVVLAVALSGIVSFHAQDQIIQAKVAAKPLPRATRVYRLTATAGLGAGLGMFLTSFLKLLG